MLIDLHNHTRALSWDSDLDVDDLVERAKKAGLDGICLTEHDYFWDHDTVRQIAKRHDYLVIPGIEVNTEDGHVLCFGLEKYVYGMHRFAELAEHVGQAGGAMVAAHPYRRRMPWHPEKESELEEALARAARNTIWDACQGVELINGRGTPSENEFSARLGEMLGRPATAGSDAHRAADIGVCATEFLGRIEGLDDLIEALRAGRCRAASLRGGA